MASRRRTRGGEEAKTKSSVRDEKDKLTINKWDSAAVKNALDDTAKKILTEERNCEEDFSIVDRRLMICTLACGFSGFALVYDYLFPFPRSEVVLAVCAISYFILMGVLSLYSLYFEGSTFMLAREKEETGVGPAKVWRVSSSMPRFSHFYTMTVSCTGGPQKEMKTEKREMSVTKWFDEEGNLVHENFHKDFKNLCDTVQPAI